MKVMTPEMLVEEGKRWGELVLPYLPNEELTRLLRDSPYEQQLRAQERRMGRIESLAHILSIRFGVEREDWLVRLSMQSRPALDTLDRAALTAVTLDEFEQQFLELTS